MKRCGWAGDERLMVAYHDREWGVPLHDDRRLFELLILEGAQAGLSWRTILNKRARYREVFDGFDPTRVARYGQRDVARLMRDAGIVRNRLKIGATIVNAQRFLDVQGEMGSFDRYVWGFVGEHPIPGRRRTMKDIPATTPESDALSEDLKRRGFKFVGSTIIYAFMQAAGLVDDHVLGCFRRTAVMLPGSK